jgi:hypothetical protein
MIVPDPPTTLNPPRSRQATTRDDAPAFRGSASSGRSGVWLAAAMPTGRCATAGRAGPHPTPNAARGRAR